MNALLIACLACTAAAAAGFAFLLAAETLRNRRRTCYHNLLRQRYLRIVMLALFAERPAVPHFPLLRRRDSRLLLAETLAGLGAMTYGLPTGLLSEITARYRLDEWLLRRARFAQGYRRARYLALLSELPATESVSRHAARYGDSRNRYVRFYALMIALTAEPPAALQRMAGCAWAFSSTEVAEITAALRRGLLPIAYRPLVASASPNLRRVGLSIVRQFGIAEAGPQLLQLLDDDETAVAQADVLHTLCALRRPLLCREVRHSLGRMKPAERRTLMRCMARSSYAPELLRRLFNKNECAYYETIVQSHKRCLV